jgi:hypothetical protein
MSVPKNPDVSDEDRVQTAGLMINGVEPMEGDAYELFGLYLVSTDTAGSWSVYRDDELVDVVKVTRIQSARALLDYLERVSERVTDDEDGDRRAPEVA